MEDQNLRKIILRELISGRPTKGQLRKLQILEGALKNYADLGIEGTTFDTIAHTCKVSRPLIQHYFPDREELFTAVTNYVRANFQHFAVTALEKGASTEMKLRNYITSTFDWIDQYPTHARVWLLFLHRATFQKKKKAQNTELARIGHERIMALLKSGIEAGEFRCEDVVTSAKLIQTIIAGALLTLGTETPSIDRGAYLQIIIKLSLHVAGFTKSSGCFDERR